ncbi:MAG TPA: SDR family oxidoreductase [Burkholderiaceae bacterium]|nr:SDR family oxidoreductase [Burkholderiaceae bacterium]
MRGIEHRVAIVSGGASGIGAGVARRLVEFGARVVVGDIVDTDGQALADALGPACLYQHADLRSDAELGALVEYTVRMFGGVDFLINAACTYRDSGAAAQRAEWLDCFDVNVFGHVVLLQHAREHLRRSDAASVVNFTTEAAHAGLAGRWVYPAAKAAIEQLTRSQALDLAEDGIRVNSVLHGWTRKPMHDTAPPEVLAEYDRWAKRLHMLGRLGTLQEASDAVLFLCSAHASFITGSCLVADGGHSALGPQARDKVLPTQLRSRRRR